MLKNDKGTFVKVPLPQWLPVPSLSSKLPASQRRQPVFVLWSETQSFQVTSSPGHYYYYYIYEVKQSPHTHVIIPLQSQPFPGLISFLPKLKDVHKGFIGVGGILYRFPLGILFQFLTLHVQQN